MKESEENAKDILIYNSHFFLKSPDVQEKE